MPNEKLTAADRFIRDLSAGLVVFIVALPLCLGIAFASDAPVFAGLVTGIVGGILVGYLSGSHTAVSGPTAGLTAVVYSQIHSLGSFEAFLLALVIGGILHLVMEVARAGFLAAFFPSSVIKGLLTAIGVLLILKQIPHVFGHDADPEGDMSFFQPDEQNTFSEFLELLGDLHPGAATIGLLSIALLFAWDKIKVLKKSNIPGPLVVVLVAVALAHFFKNLGAPWVIETSHLVQVPVAKSHQEFLGFFRRPDFTQFLNPAIYVAGFTIALVASLETLLNLQAVDKLDPQQRVSPPNSELFAQGVGNIVVGMLGGIPMTSVIVHSSVNINAGARTKLSAIIHGVFLLIFVYFLPHYVNMIPISCLAGILFVTGVKLASPAMVKPLWDAGRYQFVPFVVTLVAIIFTDLLIGIMIGLAVSISFILNSNLRRPVRRISEKHLGGEVLRIELANQVSFLNRAALEKILREVPRGGQVLLDASHTDYIDPDVLDLIREFREKIAPAHHVQVSLRGFRDKYQLHDEIQYVDYSTRDLQDQLTASQVLQILCEGNDRFRSGQRLTYDLGRQLGATAKGQHPLAVVLSCIDSRTPAEIIFDLGLGDIFSVRVAGNVSSRKILGSMEYGCAVAGAKLILVMGHTRCGAVTAAINLKCSTSTPEQATGCQHLEPIVQEIQQLVDDTTCRRLDQETPENKAKFVDDVAKRNVLRVVKQILEESRTIKQLVDGGRVAVVGSVYDVSSGRIEILDGGIKPLKISG